MSLSPDREVVLTLALERAKEDVTATYEKKLKHLRKVQVPNSAVRRRSLHGCFQEFYETLGQELARIFKEHYEAERMVLRDQDVSEIGARMSAYLHNNGYIDPDIWNYPGIFGISWTDPISQIIQKAERDLRLYIKESALKLQAQATIPLPPENKTDFSFIANPELRKIIERDYDELRKLNPTLAPKSVLVLAGSVVEGMLLDAIVSSGYWRYSEASERFLKDMIHPAIQRGIMRHDNLGNVVRVFRNMIHPAREIRDNLAFDEAHSTHARAAVDVIIGDVKSWYAKRGKTGTAAP